VYIHYPWCRKHCPYCDFAVAVARRSEPPHEAYLQAVLAELAHRAGDFRGRELVSIYFGGGTPSLWPVRHLAAVVAAVRDRWPAVGDLEVTLEANPTDCTPAAIAAWLDVGINRLSIGVQSFDAAELVTLGRDHCFGDGDAAVRVALAAGVQRVSADIILGVPGRRREPEVCDPSVVAAAELDPGHLTVYELTYEPRTALTRAVKRGELEPVDGDTLAAQYIAVHDELTGRGYEHYEISAYARSGHRSAHNSLYWRGAEYLGLGNGAASFHRTGAGGERATNVRSAKAYLAGERTAEVESLDADELAAELLWLGMRTSDGVAEAPPALERWLLDGGLAERLGGRIRPTLRGFLYADRIAARVVGG